ncbi:Six-hairpin glycosidase [Dentipellis sp. KUC8613]|nr:Six-hairpin glycosidase [Dentipellis sp. KUC8613]
MHLQLLPVFACLAAAAAAPTSTTPSSVASAGLSDALIAKVRANALNISTHSWEIGTLAEALTELEWPALSVFGADAIPPPRRLPARENARDVLQIAEQPQADLKPFVQYRVVANKAPGSLPLIDGDGAVGDPASIGSAVLLRNWTRPDLKNTSFSDAAAGQLQYLLQDAPRTPEGAISHRESQVQLWADFVYMAPPFIAYYGALQGGKAGQALLQEAYDQCRLYRDVLRDPQTGLWHHILLGDGTDDSLWGTGNGWAAAGMLRVLETIRGSASAKVMKEQQKNLTSWVDEILTGAWQYQHPNGTLFNYLNDATSFADTSSTALLATSSFRLATLTGSPRHIPAAVRALRLIRASVDADGWLQGTVDPLSFSTPSAPGVHSPEGQSFVLLLHSAWRDFLA